MGIFVTTCPHCRASNVAFRLANIEVVPRSGEKDIPRATAGSMCPACFFPISVLIIPASANSNSYFLSLYSKAITEAHDIEVHGLKVIGVWPEVIIPKPAEEIPSHVARALLQAEDNFPKKGNEDAAGTMFRKALDLALSAAFPEIEGSLYKRIDKLVERHLLTKEIGDWAHDIRLVGNDAAHDADPVERDDLVAMRGFVDAIMQYVFVLPKQVAKRRKAKVGAPPSVG